MKVEDKVSSEESNQELDPVSWEYENSWNFADDDSEVSDEPLDPRYKDCLGLLQLQEIARNPRSLTRMNDEQREHFACCHTCQQAVAVLRKEDSSQSVWHEDMILAPLKGTYRLEKLLGEGAFGAVWLATHTNDGGKAAIKRFHHRHMGSQKDGVEEVHAATHSDVHESPHVLKMLTAGNENNIFYVVWEYVNGGTVADWLARKPIPTSVDALREWMRECRDILSGVLKGLSYLHERDILHLDLKPSNILLREPEHTPVIADFGLYKYGGKYDTAMVVEHPIGTLHFIAPEGFVGEVSTRSDIYAVGVMMYLMLTGTLPFKAKKRSEVIREIREECPPPLPPTIVSALRNVIDTALAKDPANRFPSAEAMNEALNAAFEEQISEIEREAREPKEQTNAPAKSARAGRHWKIFWPKNPVMMVSIILALIVLFAVGWVLLMHNRY